MGEYMTCVCMCVCVCVCVCRCDVSREVMGDDWWELDRNGNVCRSSRTASPLSPHAVAGIS